MDMKKEIKLSDLFGRKQKDDPAAEVAEVDVEPKKKAQKQPKAANAGKVGRASCRERVSSVV